MRADPPVGIEPTLVADQAVIVDTAIVEFMESLWEAIAIILGSSLRRARVATGRRGGAGNSAHARDRVRGDAHYRDRPAAHLARRADHRSDAARRRCDDHRRRSDPVPRAGGTRHTPRPSPTRRSPPPMLAGTLITIAGFVPIGFARSAAGEYTFSLFAVVAIALIASWFVAVIFAPLISVTILPSKLQHPQHHEPGRIMRTIVACADRRDADALGDVGRNGRAFRPVHHRHAICAAAVLPDIGPAGAAGRAQARTERLDLHHRDGRDETRRDSRQRRRHRPLVTYIGRGAIRFYLPLNVQLANEFFAQS